MLNFTDLCEWEGEEIVSKIQAKYNWKLLKGEAYHIYIKVVDTVISYHTVIKEMSNRKNLCLNYPKL